MMLLRSWLSRLACRKSKYTLSSSFIFSLLMLSRLERNQTNNSSTDISFSHTKSRKGAILLCKSATWSHPNFLSMSYSSFLRPNSVVNVDKDNVFAVTCAYLVSCPMTAVACFSGPTNVMAYHKTTFSLDCF